MPQLMQLIPTLSDNEKIQLINAISERMLYPRVAHGLRHYGLDRIAEADSEYSALTIIDGKGLIRAIVNHI